MCDKDLFDMCRIYLIWTVNALYLDYTAGARPQENKCILPWYIYSHFRGLHCVHVIFSMTFIHELILLCLMDLSISDYRMTDGYFLHCVLSYLHVFQTHCILLNTCIYRFSVILVMLTQRRGVVTAMTT